MTKAATVKKLQAGSSDVFANAEPMKAPPDAEVLVAIAADRIKAGDIPNAVAMLRGALDVQLDCYNIYTNMGAVAAKAGHYEAGLACALIANELKSHDSGALSNLAIAYWRLGRYDEALKAINEAIEFDADAPGRCHNAGLIYYSLNDAKTAVMFLKRTLKAQPDNKQAKSDLALALMKSGQLHEGLIEHEGRWENFLAKSPVWACGAPMWAGEDLNAVNQRRAAKIVLHHEQGMGDTLQFVRFVPELMKRYPEATVRVLVPDALLRLMQHSFAHLGPSIFSSLDKPGDIVRAMTGAHYHCPLLSLVRVMGYEFGTLPKASPYLCAPSSPGAHRTLNTPGCKVSVGVVWSASAGHVWSRARSVDVKKMLRLASVPGVRLYSLQVGPYAQDLQRIGADLLIQDLVPTILDFADTAAYMEQLDLIISVDSAAAHLAGALGKPVWMFNPYTPCWRWCCGADVWYPTMRFFQQEKPNDDWAGPIEVMRRTLDNMVRARD